jgi:histidinol dehydrogenase
MDGIEKLLIFRKELYNHILEIFNVVYEHKDEALIEYTKQYDKILLAPQNMEISKDKWDEKSQEISAELGGILKNAADNIKKYAEKQNIYSDNDIGDENISIKDRYIPVEKAGIYVPGGEYSYPSSVLMCAIPAKAAGVEEVVMVTPPQNITPAVLAAAKIAGVDRIFRVGGPWAIMAMALGNTAIPRVDKIVGPGNIYVQAAKLVLQDIVGIDMIAGPSEVVIIADESQDPEWIAADLMAQAEHADDAAGILVTWSKELKKKVGELIPDEFSQRIKIDSDIRDLDNAVEIANYHAPEHLQLMLSEENIRKTEGKIKNAGAVFVGSNTPVAVGDYWAGPSHTLPTGRSARYQEGLNVRSFLKKVAFIKCNKKTSEYFPLIEKFASEEGMKYHAESVRKRIDRS